MEYQKTYTLVNPQNGNLAFKIYSFEDGNRFDHLQRLNYYSLILITNGSAKLKADFSEYQIQKNTLLSFSPYQPFMLTDSIELHGTAVNFHSDFFCIHKHHNEVACNGVLFNNIYEPPFILLSEKELENLLAIISQMKSEMLEEELALTEVLISYLKIFLITASRLKIAKFPEDKKPDNDKAEPFILQQLKDAIEQNYKSMHSAADYANLLNTSQDTLAKISKGHFNKTLTGLISERIILEAKRELYLTSKPIKQIAFELGFTDEYYFSRFFKTNTDISPKLYRNTVGFARGEQKGLSHS